MNDKFWEGGAKEYARVLKKEHKSKKKELQQQLDDAGDALTRGKLESQLDQLDTEYRRKFNEIDDSLF